MEQKSIVFKGTKDGLTVIIDKDMSFEDIKKQLDQKTKALKNFLKGAELFIKFNRKFEDEEIKEFVQIIEHAGNVKVVMVTSNDTVNPSKNGKNDEKDICSSKFLKGTLRSGKSINFDGNVIVLGDVNPGAEIIATGNVIILGSLRGMVHAGNPDNNNAYITALSLRPTQIRIGKVFGRSPDNEKGRDYNPEIALVKDEKIIIENIVDYNDNNGI
jgi:septum site-determining protein MinC